MIQGEEVCVPSTKWVCGEWHSGPAAMPWILRGLPRVLEAWIPIVFAFAFTALLVWFILN